MVVRLVVGFPEVLVQAAQRRLERAVETGERVFVSDLVVAKVTGQQGFPLPEFPARAGLDPS